MDILNILKGFGSKFLEPHGTHNEDCRAKFPKLNNGQVLLLISYSLHMLANIISEFFNEYYVPTQHFSVASWNHASKSSKWCY